MDEIPPAILIKIMGRPRPQPRPRIINGRAVSTLDPKIRAWKGMVERAARETVQDLVGEMVAIELAVPWLKEPISVYTLFDMPIKEKSRWGKPHTNRPDIDNLQKLVFDALEKGGLLPKGDQAVVSAYGQKRWMERGCVVIRIAPLSVSEVT